VRREQGGLTDANIRAGFQLDVPPNDMFPAIPGGGWPAAIMTNDWLPGEGSLFVSSGPAEIGGEIGWLP